VQRLSGLIKSGKEAEALLREKTLIKAKSVLLEQISIINLL
jgi:hypothetical protein